MTITRRSKERRLRPRVEGLESRVTPSLTIHSFPLSTGVGSPWAITLGADGNLWFSASTPGPVAVGLYRGTADISEIGRMTPTGQVTVFRIPPGNHALSPTPAEALVAGPDGNIWFTDLEANAIGRITPSGVVTLFPVPTPNGYPRRITEGPDGNLWFTESQANKIGKITPAGAISEYSLPSSASSPNGITTGPDGNLWFTTYHDVGRITPNGAITEFPLATPSDWAMTGAITAGADGNLWFTEIRYGQDMIGQISPNGSLRHFPIDSEPIDITAAPDGNLCVTTFTTPWVHVPHPYPSLAFMTPAGTLTHLAIPHLPTPDTAMTIGPDGNLWYTTDSRTIDQVILPAYVTGALAPGSDSGASHNDGITSVATPIITGTTKPNSRVELDVLAAGSASPTVVGRATADAHGHWSITSTALADGAYTVTAVATDPTGLQATATLMSASGHNPLIIDTTGPTVTAMSLDPSSGQLRVTFHDDLAGLNVASLLDAASYSWMTRAGWKRSAVVVERVTPVSAQPSWSGPRTVVVRLDLGGRVRAGLDFLLISARGVTDLAGNSLQGALPAGSLHQSGGAFMARIVSFGRRALPARPVLSHFGHTALGPRLPS